MPRPVSCRTIANTPTCKLFKPAGIPAASLPIVRLGLDEFEAIRLTDLEGMYQEEAAVLMEVSRPTFGRILEEARRKIALAIVTGRVLQIDGGKVCVAGARRYACRACATEWAPLDGTAQPPACPKCMSRDVKRCQRRGKRRARGA